MLDLKIKKNGFNRLIFNVGDERGRFEFGYEDPYGLYWYYKGNKDVFNSDQSYDIYVSKDNYFIYNLIDEVYRGAKEKKPYINSCHDSEIKHMVVEDDNNLFHDGMVDYHSDANGYNLASRLCISKFDDDTYKLTFNKSLDKYYVTFIVRIKDNDSRYGVYNNLFFNMYKKFHDYVDSQQLHIDEYLYEKKKKMKKII